MLLKQYFIRMVLQYGNTGILIGLILEFIGLPVPGETMMSLLGYLVFRNAGTSIVISTLFAVIGTFTGSLAAYAISCRYGEDIILKYGKYVKITKDGLDKLKCSFARKQALFLLFGRYVPGVRHLVPYVSGISKLKPMRFVIYNFIGSLFWCASFIGLGYLLGDRWRMVERLFKAYTLIIVLLAVFILIVVKYSGRYKKLILMTAFPSFLFIKLSEDLVRNELAVFDSMIYGKIFLMITSGMTIVMKVITFAGSGLVLVLISLGIYILLIRNKKSIRFGHFIVFNLLLSTLLNELFKFAFHRGRPDILRLTDISGYSFPSGHSMVSLSFYGLLVYFSIKHIRVPWNCLLSTLLCLLVLTIGISRVYLGVHYASDVLAGFSAGMAWLGVYITLMEKYFRPSAKENKTSLKHPDPQPCK